MGDPPRKLNMSDMLRSSQPNPAFHDAMDAKPEPKPDPYAHLSPAQREVHEYRDEHQCSLREAIHHFQEIKRDEYRQQLQEQLSRATSVEELKPLLSEIIDKLWST